MRYSRSVIYLVVAMTVLSACASDDSDSTPETTIDGQHAVSTTSSTQLSETANADSVFADNERWIATDLDGVPVVDGPTIESPSAAGINVEQRDGLIGGCSVDAGIYEFILANGRLIPDQFPTADLDCTLQTDASQVATIRDLVFGNPGITVTQDQLLLTNGINTLTFGPTSIRGPAPATESSPTTSEAVVSQAPATSTTVVPTTTIPAPSPVTSEPAASNEPRCHVQWHLPLYEGHLSPGAVIDKATGATVAEIPEGTPRSQAESFFPPVCSEPA